MDAISLRIALYFCTFIALATSSAWSAEYRTKNFIAYAPTEDLAQKVAFTAEQWRVRLADEWLGKTLPNWSRPCPIKVKVGQIGAGGATTFNFDRGEVYGWRMEVQGTEERILDSVIPHEVSHTIFASHFRRPLPRWADEGAATLAEHESEQRRQLHTLQQVWGTKHRIPLSNLLAMKEYPSDMRDVMTLYAEGYSLANFLVQQGGRSRYLQFLDDAETRGWETAVTTHYRYQNVEALEQKWSGWIIAGSPDLDRRGTVLASNDAPSAVAPAGRETVLATDADQPVIRAQTPETASATLASAVRPQESSATEMFADLGVPEAAVAKGQVARPAHINSFVSHDRLNVPAAATETTWRQNADARELPRVSPVTAREAASQTSSAALDFYSPRGVQTSDLGPEGFPTAVQ